MMPYPASPKQKAQVRAHRQTSKGKARHLFGLAKSRAKKKGLLFTITFDWVLEQIQNGTCQLSGENFDLAAYGRNRKNPYNPSIDQIIPGFGYTPENSRVILLGLNLALNDWGYDVYIDMATACLEHNS